MCLSNKVIFNKFTWPVVPYLHYMCGVFICITCVEHLYYFTNVSTTHVLHPYYKNNKFVRLYNCLNVYNKMYFIHVIYM